MNGLLDYIEKQNAQLDVVIARLERNDPKITAVCC
jgi:hypothetical protein